MSIWPSPPPPYSPPDYRAEAPQFPVSTQPPPPNESSRPSAPPYSLVYDTPFSSRAYPIARKTFSWGNALVAGGITFIAGRLTDLPPLGAFSVSIIVGAVVGKIFVSEEREAADSASFRQEESLFKNLTTLVSKIALIALLMNHRRPFPYSPVGGGVRFYRLY